MASRKVHAVPVHGGDLRQPILDENAYLLPAGCPQGRTEISGGVVTVRVSPGRRCHAIEELGRSSGRAQSEDADAVAIDCGVGQFRDPKPVGEIEGVDGADRISSGAVGFAAKNCKGGQGRHTGQQGAAAETAGHRFLHAG
jgi:hypothetical protein